MQKTWKPTVAGILDIVSGVCGLTGFLFLIIGAIVSGFIPEITGMPLEFLRWILVAIAIPLALVSILALVGGIYAVQRKMWGLALAGSIAAFFGSSLLGIAAIVLTAISKNEFQ